MSRHDPPSSGADGAGADALTRALDRWRRGRSNETSDRESSPSWEDIGELTRRLDDTGCAFGRVSAARLDHLTRAYDRLETKLNAVLLAVTGTFLSTLASLLLYYVRGGAH